MLPHVARRHYMRHAAVEIGRGMKTQLAAVVGAQGETVHLLNARADHVEQDAAHGLRFSRGRAAHKQCERTQKSEPQPRSSFSRWVKAGTICFQSPTTP